MKKIVYITNFLFSSVFSLYSQVFISELSPSNGVVKDKYSQTSDWVEIATDSSSVNIANWRISDKPDFNSAFTLPERWITSGSPLLLFASGNHNDSEVIHELTGAGSWIGRWSSWERNTFNYTQLSKNASLTVRINSIQHDSTPVEAVLMIRENLSENSRYIGIAVQSNGICVKHVKPSTNPNSDGLFFRLENCPIDVNFPDCYLRLEKVNDSIMLSVSRDGFYWYNSNFIHFPINTESYYAGIAIAPTNYALSQNIRLTYSRLIVNEQPIYVGFDKVIGIMLKTEPKKGLCNEIHLPFRLSASGETIYLWNKEGKLIDTISWLPLPYGTTYGSDISGTKSLLQIPTPGKKNGSIAKGICNNPKLNVPSGFYKSTFYVKLLDTTNNLVHFSVNGEIPNESSPRLHKDSLLHITSNSIIRIRSFNNDYIPSECLTYTYIFDQKENYPTLFLNAPDRYWWSDSLGILYEKDGKNNLYSGIEIPIALEYLHHNISQFKVNAGCSLRGSYSRTLPQKPFDISFRSRFGSSTLQYRLFDKPIHEFEKFALRNGGQDWWSTSFRDNISAILAKNSGLMYQSFQPTRVYINGHYWGHYMMQENSGDEFVANNYEADKNNISMVGMGGNPLHGSSKDFNIWRENLSKSDCSIDSVFEEHSNQIDINQFYLYTSLQVFIGNRDFPGNNVKLWKDTVNNSPWRFILYDTDLAHASQWGYDADIFKQILSPVKLNWANDTASTVIWRKFFSNRKCRDNFLTVLADELNTHFSAENYVRIIDSLNLIVKNEISDHRKRWKMITSDWDKEIQRLKGFGKERQNIVRKQAVEAFSLDGLSVIHVQTLPNNSGNYIKVSKSLYTENRDSAIFFKRVPIRIEAVSAKGWKFSHWRVNDSVIVTSNDFNFAPDHDTVMITAEFTQDTTVSSSKLQIAINEIMYKPQDDRDCKDWIEIVNYGKEPIDLSRWVLKDDSDAHFFTLPINSVLQSDEHLVVCEDTSKFLKFYARPHKFLGNLDFGFGRGDQVRLFDSSGIIIDSVSYLASYPWDVNADGTGNTLELRAPDLDNSYFGNWYATGIFGGTPGVENTPTLGAKETISDTIRCFVHNSEIIILNMLNKNGLLIFVTNLEGKVITKFVHEPGNEIRISLSEYPHGVYLINCLDIFSNKIVLQEKVLYLQ